MSKKYSKQSPQIIEMQEIFNNLDVKFRYVRTHSRFSSVGNDDLLERYRHDISHIHYALQTLTPEQSYIITQTFHFDGTFSNTWWKGIFTKSTFYRKRREAIDIFLMEYHQSC